MTNRTTKAPRKTAASAPRAIATTVSMPVAVAGGPTALFMAIDELMVCVRWRTRPHGIVATRKATGISSTCETRCSASKRLTGTLDRIHADIPRETSRSQRRIASLVPPPRPSRGPRRPCPSPSAPATGDNDDNDGRTVEGGGCHGGFQVPCSRLWKKTHARWLLARAYVCAAGREGETAVSWMHTFSMAELAVAPAAERARTESRVQ